MIFSVLANVVELLLVFKYNGRQTVVVYRILAVIHRKSTSMQPETIIMLPELKIEVLKN